MELDDASVKAELDDIMARIDGILKRVETFEGNLKENHSTGDEQSNGTLGVPAG